MGQALEARERIKVLQAQVVENRKLISPLIAETKALVEEMIGLVRQMDNLDCWLEQVTMQNYSKIADEIEAEGLGNKKERRGRLEVAAEAVKTGTTTGRTVSSKPNIETVERAADGKKKRTCSLCRKPGHRAQNCPNASAADVKAAVQKNERRKLKKGDA